MSDGKLVLVTGASGFIAGHVIEQLLEKGYSVRGTVRNPQNEKKNGHLNAWIKEGKKLELVKADLLETTDDEWDKIMNGVTYVQHTASPFPDTSPKDESILIKPAVQGTTVVLNAASRAGVKRVVLTSSLVAILGGHEGETVNEELWTKLDKTDAYGKSKTLAEQAAWKLVKELPEDKKIEMNTVNPGFVLGPTFNQTTFTSQIVICKMLNRELPAIPNLSMPVVDVRDVGKAHVAAMEVEQHGERFLCADRSVWFPEVGVCLNKEFKPLGYNVPTTQLPYAIAYIASFFDKQLAMILPQIGNKVNVDNSKSQKMLGIEYRPWDKAFTDMGYSVIEQGFVKKTKKYLEKFPETPKAETK